MNARLINMLLSAIRQNGGGGDDDDERYPNRELMISDDEWQDNDSEQEAEPEDEENKQNSQENIDAEKPSGTSQLKINNPWKKHIHKHDNTRGVSYIHESLQEEHEENLKKAQESRSSVPKREKISNRILQPNPLLQSLQSQKTQASQSFIPNEISYTFEGICSRIYNANFNHRGDVFLATSQIGTAMFDYLDDNKVRLNKTITCNNVSWTISDSDFTYDDKYMIHSTLSPNIQLFDVENKKYLHQLCVDPDGGNQEDSYYWYGGMRVYSAKISADGQEVIAGTSKVGGGYAKIQVFDVPQSRIVRSIKAHTDDVNSVCFVDKLNSSLIISGSDDGLCKLWDTRTTNANNAVGIFYGHMSGMTNVCSKEDNRYFISNCKDQALKLWDIRKSSTDQKKVNFIPYDYRMETLDPISQGRIREKMRDNKNDNSVKTFFGHQVRETLIRCHFSPRMTTDQRYIYTGSADSCVYIYDIHSGQNVARLQVEGGRLIRDCAWHPYSQNIVTGDFAGNVCRWEFIDSD